MSPAQLNFDEIHVRRMPGFEDGGFKVEGLCDGVNVIYGPNASGKTTLSRAIQRLLRLDAPTDEPISLSAIVAHGGQALTIDYDYGRVRCQQQGIPIDPPPRLAPPEVEQHCVLSLHDLIQSRDGSNLAAEIVRRTAGGYDVAQARDSLWPRAAPRRRGSLHGELDAASAQVREVRGKQADLARSEDRLADLRRRRGEARQAKQRLEKLLQWKKVLQAKAAVDQTESKLTTFPAAMENIGGDEAEQLSALRRELDDAKSRKITATRDRDTALRSLQESPLPVEGISSESVSALRKQCTGLRELRNKLEEQQAVRDAAEGRVKEAAAKLGSGVTLAHVERINADTTRELFALVRQAEKARADKYASERLAQWLGEAKPPKDAAALGEGVQLLEQWLAANAHRAEAQKAAVLPWIVAGAIVVVLAFVLSLVAHLSSLVFLLVGAALVAWPFVAPRLLPGQENATAQIERNYASLRIAAPQHWDDAQVRAIVRQHRQTCAAAAVEQEKAARWTNLSNDVKVASDSLIELQKKRDDWREKLGVEVNIDEADLYLLASNFAELFKAQQELAGASSKVEKRQKLLDLRTKEIQEGLSPYGFSRSDAPETLDAQIEELASLREKHAQAREEVRRCERDLRGIAENIEETGRKIRDLFSRLGLTPDEEPKLQELLRLRDDYVTSANNLINAKADLRAAQSACHADESFKAVPADKIDEEIALCGETASSYDQLNDEIIGIEKEIELAKKASDVEHALAKRQKLEDDLRQQRDEDCAASVGHLLAEFLAAEQRVREQPRVMRRAEELFVRFTHGRYKLLVDGGDPPMFRAMDTARRVGQALEELSSGTRLQLLLAVHVAFVEEQESQCRLPLLFDETLGNSDERRAREIIEAAIEICKGGRQVFYFTAQHDEVGKWRSILPTCGNVPYQEIDLAQLRNFSQDEQIVPMPLEPPAALAVPPPGSADWIAYGRMLEVPSIKPRQDSGDVHLWYVVHDPPLLHRLLRGGINRWGQMQTLVEYHSLDGIEPASAGYRRAVAAAETIEAACRLFGVGRGKPVDRQALLDSGAVTDNFINAVADLCRELGGDAAALLQALDDGKVSRFQNAKKLELREYLAAQGFLDEEDCLPESEVVRRVCAAVFPHIEKGLIELARVQQLVQSVMQSSANRSTD